MAAGIEKFSSVELIRLRNELLRSGMDSWQAADIVTGFLTGRGYGADPTLLRTSLLGLENASTSLERMQEELEKIAFVM